MLLTKFLNYTQVFLCLYFSFHAQGRIQLLGSLNEASVLAFPASLQETLRAVEAQDNLCGLFELISNLSLSLSR